MIPEADLRRVVVVYTYRHLTEIPYWTVDVGWITADGVSSGQDHMAMNTLKFSARHIAIKVALGIGEKLDIPVVLLDADSLGWLVLDGRFWGRIVSNGSHSLKERLA